MTESFHNQQPAVSQSEPKQENVFLNLIINIAIPVFIINKSKGYVDPKPALLIALAFPLVYGTFDYFRRKKVNYFAILGLVNIASTGGFALLGLTGIWFSIKEAFFPALIGTFVFFSAWSKEPFMKKLFLNPQLMNMHLIEEKLAERGREHFDILLKHCTLLFSGSFFISAILNFGLSRRIFTDIPQGISDAESSVLLNEQIAQMTQWSMLVIMLPSMVILTGILWYMVVGLERTTGLHKDQIFKS